MYVVKTGNLNQILFIVSILQSLFSMTSAILNEDDLELLKTEFKKYKQRFPPTLSFIKRLLFRYCEITYRIGIFTLFWAVCGGMAVIILLIFEFLLVTFGFVIASAFADG